MASRRSGRRLPARVAPRHAGTAPSQKPLFKAKDHGAGVTLNPEVFAPAQRGGGWGPFAESFLRMNEASLAKLDVKPEVGSSDAGVRVRLVPGGRAGAIPLRSAQTGHVGGGLVVEPRFGWSGVGNVLSLTGWAAAPEFLEGPLVPGSGREVPPWVLAGPVLARLAELLESLRRGYHAKEEILHQPRGRILWDRYIAGSLATGRWADLPCRYPELATDPLLRRMARWGLERVRSELAIVGGRDPVARLLVALADDLLFRVRDVLPLVPRRVDLERIGGGDRLLGVALRRGLEALGWVADERGLGGGREMDGLSWTLPLHELWEHYVEGLVRREAALVGGSVRVGRKRETVFPIEWSDPSHRSLGHLVPDIVVFTGKGVHVVDAKYKAHLAELDEQGWQRFTEDAREAHRADVHQVLAYAGLYAADEVSATLVYPLRQGTFEALARRGRGSVRGAPTPRGAEGATGAEGGGVRGPAEGGAVSGSGRADIVAFAERLLELLDQGSFQTTYKYAVLLGLMDLCVEHTSTKGAAPTSVTTRQLAEKVLELYWSHTRPFDPERRPDLLQGKTGEAEILQRIRRFRTESAADPSATLAQARRANAHGFERLTAFVEWKLIEMPLPRLQFFGNVDLRFVYQIGWDAKVRRSDTLDGFDNRILFVEGASDSLVRLAGLLRPLVQRQWAAMVARLNKLVDAQLEEFLFGVDRADLGPIRGPLRELQGGRCFYCGDAIRSEACVDHFMPWARYPDNGIHNLVLADGRCNGDKSAFLAAPEHLARWTARAEERAGDLAQIASRAKWDAHPERTLSIARAIYLRLPSEAKLWRQRGVFVDADRARIAAVLAS